MTTQHQPQPHTDGWIEWSGGKCPVDPDTIVDVRDRDGSIWTDWPAGRHDWRHGTSFPNEEPVAYRLSQPFPNPPSTTQSQTGRQSDV